MKLKSIILAALLLTVSAAFAAVEPNDVLKELKNKIAPDKRTAIWDDVKAVLKGDMLTIEGTVGTIQQKEAISRALNALQADGLITLHRGRIEIPLLERLLMQP